MAKTASTYDDIVVKLPIIVLAGEDADVELDDDNPFEAGLNLLVKLIFNLDILIPYAFLKDCKGWRGTK